MSSFINNNIILLLYVYLICCFLIILCLNKQLRSRDLLIRRIIRKGRQEIESAQNNRKRDHLLTINMIDAFWRISRQTSLNEIKIIISMMEKQWQSTGFSIFVYDGGLSSKVKDRIHYIPSELNNESMEIHKILHPRILFNGKMVQQGEIIIKKGVKNG